MMDDSLRKAFSEECDELLERMEHVLLEMESNPKNHTLIDELFRIVHTIKGSSGLVGFDQLVHFSHELENLAVQVREGELEVTHQLCDIMLESRDLLSSLVDTALGRALDETLESLVEREATLISKIKVYAPNLNDTIMRTGTGGPAVTAKPAPVTAQETEEAVAADNTTGASMREYCIEVNLEPEVLMFGLDPMASILYLQDLGEIKQCLVDTSALPDFSAADFTCCYLNFKLIFESSKSLQQIEDAFMFLHENSSISICETTAFKTESGMIAGKAVTSAPDNPAVDLSSASSSTPSQSQNSDTERAKEASSEITEGINGDASLNQDALGGPSPNDNSGNHNNDTENSKESTNNGSKKNENATTGAETSVKASRKEVPAKGASVRPSPSTNETVRVDAKKLENLIDLVGELVIANANTHLLAKNGEAELLMDATDAMLGLVEDIRDTTLSLRMVQIGTVFNRYKRVVREVSQELGKNIDLVITGGDTELDKTIVDKISDPLMHMIRNAIDHGIESPAERRAAGKDERGVVKLNAYHDSGVIVIEIEDDGKGLIKENILSRAEERGIISDKRLVPDRNVYDLIFYPGFSTAEKVTNLSGRGVGMDVVKKNIDALNGHIDVVSEAGAYTKISIRLPLTLAIIDGFLFEVGGLNYVVPLDMVDECVEFSDENNANYVDTQFINLRGEIMPFMRLKEFFDVQRITDCKQDFKQHVVKNKTVSGTHESDGDTSVASVPYDPDAVSESISSPSRDRAKRESVIVIRSGASKSGIVVDKLLGEYQTVIKPVGRVFKNLEWLSGATILGNGDVAIIIDVLMLIKHVFAQLGDDERWMAQEAS